MNPFQIKGSVTALSTVLVLCLASPGVAQARDEADLLAELKSAEAADAKRIEAELVNLWSSSGSDSMDFLLKRGRDAIEVQNWPRAIEHLTALTDHAPEFAEGYYARALAYFRSEQFGPAMADLEQALALNPNHYAAIRGVGAILETLGDAERAFAAYEMVLALHPNDTEAQEGLERMRGQAEGQAL